ncbi:restriction endonuclease subunit R [Coraliomargarita sinensis]|uniref:Type I restriction enzyme endonuclease subunit n=1 Tax=Coraliomargarita sinensis TaxID=2174842 RepID=A0A317ZG61_9BACT|nr:HsdR family type I site-specific deoxyribonuclease [Coraliomargarita sinensis]PXA04624.1 restriction endonuclease subunit R [Coraliomargarita sinensis]
MSESSHSPSTLESVESQLPALHQLINLGFQYLTPAEVEQQRGGRLTNCFLDGIVREQLEELNQVETLNGTYAFSESAIQECLQALKDFRPEGLIATNEKAYDLLCLGRSVEQVIDGRKSSYTVRYIDWETPSRNVFHVAAELSVEKAKTKETRRPDIVCFVNGIPFAVIEAKAPDPKVGVSQAISQHLRNQHLDEIPDFFRTQQFLLAVNAKEGRYATVGTPTTHWLEWKEDLSEKGNEHLLHSVNAPLQAADLERLLAEPFKPHEAAAYREKLSGGDRLPTGQDKLIYSILRPERLLEMVYRFIVFDAGAKKVARYQQYFAVRDIMERVLELDSGGARKGGVVWHTQGSGKSLTMVMLAKAIALCGEIPNPRVVLVTDRVDLDDQIKGTFKSCGLDPKQAASGNDLVKLLKQERDAIISAVINKFDAACNKRDLRIDDPNIFVLVDEAHRTNYGSLHAHMRRVFPKACFIGFTGTPLMSQDKSTQQKFGGIIGRPYTINEAVNDGAVLRLRYEARKPEIDINREALDKQFEQQTEGLIEEEQAELKKKTAKFDNIAKTNQVIYQIARDISQHYEENWKGTFAKGQIVTPRKDVALKYKQALDEIGKVTSEVIISPPDDREGFDNAYGGNKDEVARFWKEMMIRYGNERNYNRTLIQRFKTDDEPEIIIVVSKLLTGFDAPRNTILYVCAPLKNHTLLQAIARVNRLYKDPVNGEEKDYGYIIDYRGILGELSLALDQYTDDNVQEEVDEVLVDIEEEVRKLPFAHSALWDIFKEVSNKKDREALENHLEDEERRDVFFDRLNVFAKVLASAKQSLAYYETVPQGKQKDYVDDLRFFAELRSSVRRRFTAEVDVRPYEQRIQKILNLNTVSSEVSQLTELVDIFDREAFQRELEKAGSEKSKADTIISRTKKTISEKWDEDPVFYERFSRMLDKILEDYRQKRLSDADRLKKAQEVMEAVRDRTGDDIPAVLRNKEIAKAYFGWAHKRLENYAEDASNFKDVAAQLAVDIEGNIDRLRIVNWKENDDVKNEMSNAIEDAVLGTGLKVPFDELDELIKDIIDIATKRLPNQAAS